MASIKSSYPYDLSVKTLVLGAGGGFDLYGCLYWYLHLTEKQKDLCVLANYSFTDDLYKYETSQNQWIIEITEETKETQKNIDYFPELHLAKSLKRPIYAVRLIPNPLLMIELEQFILEHEIKQIILVDGGVDAMLYGDETSFGSPLEDSQTMIACYQIATKYDLSCKLMCCALHVDEVSPNYFLKHWDEMTKLKMDCHQIKLEKDDIFISYQEIIQTSKYASIIHESILASLQGHRDIYQNPRLFPDRIDNVRHMPVLQDETCYLWWVDVKQYVSFSPFYQALLKCQPTIDHKQIDEQILQLWRYWDDQIDDNLLERQKRKLETK